MAASDDLKRQIRERGDLPRHVAIIMDGNGRWARRRMLPRIMGHREGRKAVRRVVEAGAELGLEVLTLFTFSIENWQRPRDEVQSLMQYLEEVLESEFLDLEKNNIRLAAMGRLDILPAGTLSVLRETERRLAARTGMVLNLALSYSGRAEIVDACRAVARAAAAGTLDPADLDEEAFSRHLYLPELGNVDLLIRTSGEQRISNFCLWQLAYAEIHLTDTLWPDFGKDDFYRAILDYQSRERRFGRVT
ncbi:MAG: di-trans,poly-cis-decaprenylcistransferase [Candidatus Krumholzibacteriota bacterium]|nr:di-trans,poly-cis-decaprenylcistransferase [Candidatus Krumholzibacteriota bacterium]